MAGESLNDDELMLKVKAGDKIAFTVLFRRHSSAVFGLCMRFFSGNRSRSEDVSQEVWTKVVIYARTYETEGKFKSWLFQVTRNSALREIEKNQVVYQMVHEDDVDLPAGFDLRGADALAVAAELDRVGRVYPWLNLGRLEHAAELELVCERADLLRFVDDHNGTVGTDYVDGAS